MQPLGPDTLLGTWAPLLLPLAEDGSVDLARMEDELEALADAGVDGVTSGATSDELRALDEGEYASVHERLAESSSRAGLPYVFDAAHAEPGVSLARIRATRHLEPGAFLVRLDDEVSDARERASLLATLAAAAVPAPLVLHDVGSPRTRLGARALAQLVERVPAVVGAFVAADDEDRLDALRPLEDELALVVPGHELASGWRRGASASFSSLACLAPAGAARWARGFEEDLAGALALERRVQRFLEDHLARWTARPGGAALRDKLLCAAGGWCAVGTRTRDGTSGEVDPREVSRLAELARERLPELFADDPADTDDGDMEYGA